MMHKGMTQQIFIFIFALIMMALVLVFGIRQLFVVTDTASTVETLAFVEDFKKEVQTYTTFDAGSTKNVRISVPSAVHQLCFFNPQLPVAGISDPVFKALLQGDKKNNLFVLPLEEFQSPGPGFFIPHFVLQGPKNPYCTLAKKGLLQVMIETVSVDTTTAVTVREL